jgi:small conductance mechanosensitive channel
LRGMDSQQFRKNISHYRRWLSLEVIILIVGIILIFSTIEISRRGLISFITTQKDYILSVEAAVVSILLIEIIGRIIVYQFQERGARAYGIYIRTVIRIVGYLVVIVIIISILASNTALAISIGTITGVIIGFASQNITSNVLAAGLLVATRIVKVGDTITVTGNTGQIIDITLIHTIIETENGRVFVPNSTMITTAVLKRKNP